MIKILFADDDLKYSMLLKSFLQQHGYDVTYAGNGKKAWEQFPEVKPDLVLLDINMPEMDGYEVAERIRTIDPKVLIFFLTDRTEKNDRLKGFSLKANDYLAKPFYPEELLARIEERFSMNESETIEEEVYHFGETTFCYNNNELRTRSSRVLITSRQADILRLLVQFQTPCKPEPHQDIPAALKVQAMSGGCRMDQPHRDFPLIPPPDIPLLIQSGEADLKSGKPILDPFQVMLVPIGRKDRLPVRRLNDVLQSIQLPVMDLFISAVSLPLLRRRPG